MQFFFLCHNIYKSQKTQRNVSLDNLQTTLLTALTEKSLRKSLHHYLVDYPFKLIFFNDTFESDLHNKQYHSVKVPYKPYVNDVFFSVTT